ncbi:ABC transporter permease [Acidimangrovimonas sediminis]|uniref:ABC transporter permease n=1 Tax=Acidimangrovimonas sediminis TaxID=2056283 RepID=UPI000C7FA5B5|nr:ABC transporter permease [Acidimangrovimonas sediminis]
MGATGFQPGRIGVLVLLTILALGGFALGDPGILSGPNLYSMAVFSVEIGIIAFGQTLVICGGDGGIDLSVGAIGALAQVLLGLAITAGLPWPLAVAICVAAGAGMGMINGACVTRLDIPPIITTLATMFVFSGLALVLTGGINIDLTTASAAFLFLGQGAIAGLPFQLVALYLPALLILIAVQHRAGFGRALYLVGTSTTAARLTGLRPNRIRARTYAIAGLMAGIAGAIGAARLGTASPEALGQANLISIAIVVLGGSSIFGGDGSVVGTMVATVLIGVVNYGLSYMNFNPVYQAGVMGLILIGAVLIDNAISGRGLSALPFRMTRSTG